MTLKWRGCKPWNDQFWTRTYSQDPKPITLGKLAERIAAAVKGLLAYSIGRRTFTQAIEAERVTHVLHLLFRADRMDPDNARIITYILLNFMLKLGEYRMDLAVPVCETVVREIKSGLETAWKVRSPR